MKVFFYLQTLLLGIAIYFSTTYLNNGLLRYFPKEADSLVVINLDDFRRIKGMHSISSSLSKMLVELSPEYKEYSEAFPISAVDQISTAEYFVKGGKPNMVTAAVLNKPLPDLFAEYQEKAKDKKSSNFVLEQDPEDSRLFVSKIKGEVKDYTYVLSPTEVISFSAGMKAEMLKRLKATVLKDSIYSNKELQDIKKLETRHEIIWGLGHDKQSKEVDTFFLSVDSINGHLVTEVNVAFSEIEMGDQIFRMASQVEKIIEDGTAKSPYAKFFEGDWLEFDVHSGTFKVKFRFSENLLGKHMPKISKQIDKMSMKDIQSFMTKAQKQHVMQQKKK